MTWLDRLKGLRQTGSEVPRHRQNRQNPGFVSFDSPAEAHIPSGELDPVDNREAFEARAAIASKILADTVPEGPVRWPFEEWGDLRPCLLCRSLSPGGRCLAAWRGELRAARDYSPTFPGQPQRCIGYRPKADDPDQTPGRERWPELAEWQARAGDGETTNGGGGG